MANTFHLEVVTPEGVMVDEQVESCIVRTTEGDLGILHGHTDFMAAIEVGQIRVKEANGYRVAAAADGFVQVGGETTRVVVTTFEWSDKIDVERAKAAKQKATDDLGTSQSPEMTSLAKYRLKKAKNRLKVAGVQ